MLKAVIYFVLLLLFCGEISAKNEACSKLPDIPESTTLSTLRRKLKCGYDKSKPPTNSTSPRVPVQIHLDRNRIQFSATDESVTSHTYFLVVWQDDRLKWEKSEYKNRSLVYMRPSDIWSPDLESESYFRYPKYVLVSSLGEVMLLLWWEFTVHCKATYSKWTDKRICKESFQLEPADKIRLKVHYWISYMDDDRHSSWRIVDVETIQSKALSANLTEVSPTRSKLDTNGGRATLEIHIVRNTAIIEATLYSPAIVLFLVILASTWIPCGESIRIGILALTILLESFLMNTASTAIPTLPGRFSDFSVLYRDMVLVSGVAVFEWYIAYLIASKKISSTGRLQSLAATASQSTYAFLRSILLIPANPFKVENGTLEGAFLSVILDRIVFAILLLVFVIIMLVTAHSEVLELPGNLKA